MTATPTSTSWPRPAAEPRRLTWHPGADVALGWTPDGKGVVFQSARASNREDLAQLYVVPVEGGVPSELPLPSGDEASYSPDASRLAYTPFFQWEPAWKHYRGGQTARIWIADLSDSHVEKIPARQLQRHAPDVARRQGLLPLRPRRPGDALQLRRQDQGGRQAGRQPRRLRHGLGLGRAGAPSCIDHFDRLEIFDLAPPARPARCR